MLNRIVAHYSDGTLLKGTTADFFPNKVALHLTERNTGYQRLVTLKDLKGLFFVKTYDGDPSYRDKHDVERLGLGKKIRISFNDGEVMVGYTQGYSPVRQNFLVFPADPQSNNDRVLVVTSGTREVSFL